jgi:hypothetical protein
MIVDVDVDVVVDVDVFEMGGKMLPMKNSTCISVLFSFSRFRQRRLKTFHQETPGCGINLGERRSQFL